MHVYIVVCDFAVLSGHGNVSIAHIFKHCGQQQKRTNFTRCISEARVRQDGAHKVWKYCTESFFDTL